ncbi:MAG: leucine-rich repeat domain-containing protein, partial [Muribaculaceae bacterium]|nr:leucine-rich repeat domain-containing protein [Muribaculaceae bacterium]
VSYIEMDENGGECMMIKHSGLDTASNVQFSFDYPYEINRTYCFSFDVKGTYGKITSQFENSETYTNCGNCSDFEITPEWTTVTVMGKTEDKGEIVNRWVANIGDYEGTMYIRNMKIYTLAEEPISAGETFTYDGINYEVVDPMAQICRVIATKQISGECIIPEAVPYRSVDFAVSEIDNTAFAGNDDLRSVTLPVTIDSIGRNAFADCGRLTSLVWQGRHELPGRVLEEIGNPNLVVYVDASEYAPVGIDCNIVVDGVCQLLDLTPGYAFTPVKDFTALHSRMVKEFTQKTYVGLCAGWETIVLPFDVAKVYAENIESELVPFSVMTDRYSQRPYWLYEADPNGEWIEASYIRAGIPYIISTPNNSAYPATVNINGPVVFSNDAPQTITPETTAPYAVSWASGSEFRPVWLPLDKSERSEAMGLNSGLGHLRGEDGKPLPPGSNFHVEVSPSPLEAYVTRLGSERARKVMGSHTLVVPEISGEDLEVHVKDGAVNLRSASDRRLTIYKPDGVTVRRVDLRAGETVALDDLTCGIYIIAGQKVIVNFLSR